MRWLSQPLIPHQASLADATGKPPTSPVADALGLYIHIPFCAKKCPYCDFNTYANLGELQPALVDALCVEMDGWRAALAGRPLDTIFLGGGTPTLLTPAQIEQLFAAVRRNFSLSPHCSITSEANPGTVDSERFAALRANGVDRLSLGVQSFQPQELSFLGRIHDVADVYRAYDTARAAGFDDINLDFIFGLPQQTPQAWSHTLAEALALAPEHLSLYSLIVEPETPLHHWVQIGKVDAPDEDVAAEHYEIAMQTLGAAGYKHYEVSNWAQTGDLASRHNLLYWRNQEYLGVGPGAHSHLRQRGPTGALEADRRFSNHKPVGGYIRRIREAHAATAFAATAFEETLDGPTARGETMMLGLRLIDEGVAHERFAALHDADLRAVYADELAQLTDWGLIEQLPDRVRLTPRGLMIANSVLARFLPDG